MDIGQVLYCDSQVGLEVIVAFGIYYMIRSYFYKNSEESAFS